MPSKPKKQLSQEEIESSIVETMVIAQELAEKTFGAAWNTHAVEEITSFLQAVGGDLDEFAPDLERIYKHAQKVYKTTSPTPEQVFGIFDRIYSDDE